MRTVVLHDLGHAWTFGQLSNALRDLDVQPRHVLHVGAHLGQEVPHYRAAGIERITLVEPTPANADHLRQNFPDVTVIEAACGWGRWAELQVCGGDGAWNTLRPTDGAETVTVPVLHVDEIQLDADMLVVDTQGTELEVLMNADLSRLKLVVVETSTVGSLDAAPLDDVVAFMAEQGWTLVLLWSHDRPGDSAVGFRDAFFMPAPTLTICVATIGQRAALFGHLLDGLLPQVAGFGGRVKVRAFWDNGEHSIADKRQALVEAVDTDYVCFVDDDDTVTDDYASAIMEALNSRPDFVGLWMMVYRDGQPFRRAELSLKHNGWFDGPDYYCRDITHENPMRSSIVRQVDFRAKSDDQPEDTPWASQLRASGLLRNEVMVDRVLYNYWWVPDRSAWGMHSNRVQPAQPDGSPWERLEVESPHFAYLET